MVRHTLHSPMIPELSDEAMNAMGQAHGPLDKTFGIFLTCFGPPLPNALSFSKKLLRWQ